MEPFKLKVTSPSTANHLASPHEPAVAHRLWHSHNQHQRRNPTPTMSREAYQVPSASGGTYVGAGAASARDLGPAEGPMMQYICSDCAVKMSLRKNEPIRCKECGGRVLYKERTKRYVANAPSRGWSGELTNMRIGWFSSRHDSCCQQFRDRACQLGGFIIPREWYGV